MSENIYPLHGADDLWFLLFTGDYDSSINHRWHSLPHAATGGRALKLELQSSKTISILVHYDNDRPVRPAGPERYAGQDKVKFKFNDHEIILSKIDSDSANADAIGPSSSFTGNGTFFELDKASLDSLGLETGVQNIDMVVDNRGYYGNAGNFEVGSFKLELTSTIVASDPDDQSSSGEHEDGPEKSPDEQIKRTADQRAKTKGDIQKTDAEEIRDSSQGKNVQVENIEVTDSSRKIKLRINADSFLKRQGAQSSISQKGEAFTAFLRSKGYEIITMTPLKSKNGEKIELILSRKEASFKEKRKIETLEAIYAFNKVASMLLTEPYLYLDSKEEVRAELKSIKDMFGESVLPMFYQTMESAACGENHAKYITANLSEEDKNLIKTKLKESIIKLDENATLEQEQLDVVDEHADFIAAGIIGALLAPLLFPVTVAGGLATALVFSGGYLGYALFNSGDDVKINTRRIRISLKALSVYLGTRKLAYTKEDIMNSLGLTVQFVADKDKELKRAKAAADVLSDAISKTKIAEKNINGAVNMIIGKYFSLCPPFKHFEDIVYKMGTSSALNLLLKPEKLGATENTHSHPTNLYAEEIIGSEGSDYLYKMLAYPWYEDPDWLDTENASSIYAIESSVGDARQFGRCFFKKDASNNQYLTYNSSKYDVLDKMTFFNLSCRNLNLKKDYIKRIKEEKELFDFSLNSETFLYSQGEKIYKNIFYNKSKIRAQQEKKKQFLLALRDAIVQEVIAANATDFYEDPRMKRFVEKFSKGSIFKIADTSAYPDIDLPTKDMSVESVNVYNPDFYYFKPQINEGGLEKDAKALEKVITKSSQFKRDIREHIVTNKPIELGGARLSLTSSELIAQRSGSKVKSYGTQRAKLQTIGKGNFGSFGVTNIPISLSRFENSTQLENYINGKKAEIEIAENEVNALRSAMGQRNFSKIIDEEEVKQRLRNFSGKDKSLENFANLMGISEAPNYNSPEELSRLAVEANKSGIDMMNLGMSKAFPTFRFYLVEEDAVYSNKMTVYDDFYSYASVISFTVHSSRELPASTAQIVLQNVSGVLDGSKKEVLRDIDVDSRKIYSGQDDKIVGDIESIVLRPGVNAQLRAGYSATCRELDILISGRITEVQYSNDGMTTNITLQSYGIELDSKIENNLARKNENNLFYSTHQLLGGLMLSTQLKHFGRIKTGKIFQDGETKSAALDNRMPTESAKFSYYYTNMFAKTLGDRAQIIMGAVIVGGVLRYFGGPMLSRFKWFQSASAVSQRFGARAYALAGSVGRATPTLFSIKGKAFQPFYHIPKYSVEVGKFLFNPLRALTKVRPAGAGITVEEGQLLSNVLKRLKNGTPVLDLSPAEQKLVVQITSSLGKAEGTAITTALKARGLELSTAVGDAAFTEAAILLKAIEQQGMAFSLSNFTTRGLSIATSSLTRAELGVIQSLQRAGYYRSAVSLELGAIALSPLGKIPFLIGGSLKLGGSLIAGLGRGVLQTGGLFVGVGGVVGFLGLFMDTVYNGVRLGKYILDEGWEAIFDEEKDDTLRILLSPQDDNLFLPDADSYLKTENKKPEDVGFYDKYIGVDFGDIKYPALNAARFGTGMLQVATYNISEFLGISVRSQIQKRFEEFQGLFDTRLDIDNNENYYYLKGQTIFNVFHEMTLRHPGYVYGARPYGDSIEYRMFFGLPSQRYWAEDISTLDVVRVNKILRELSESKDRLLSYKTCMLYYPKETQRFINNKVEAYNFDKFGIQTSYSEKVKAKDINNEDIKNLVRLKITQVALKEYIDKTNKRFIPFRKIHLMHSARNIIANNIIVSGHDVINTVSVNYSLLEGAGNEIERTDGAGRSMYAINLSSNTAIPPELQKPKTFTSENIIGPAAAYRYAIGQLMYGGKNMYQGSVLTLGNPKVHPWDVLVINDDVNRMYGPVEVKEVKHMFSHETGFLTDIEVNALVAFGEDSMTYPTIVSSILSQAKEQIFNKFASRALFEREVSKEGDTTYYNNLIGKIIEDSIGENATPALKSALKTAISLKIKEEMQKAKEERRPFFLRDVLENDIDLPEEFNDDLEALASVLIEGGVLYGAAKSLKYGINKSRGGISQVNQSGKAGLFRGGPIGRGYLAFMAISASAYIFSDSIIDNIEDSLNSGKLGKNLFRPVLMSKVSNQSIIEVYPLVKDGKPLLAGGFEGVPASQSYQNILGNIFSDLSDGLSGFIKHRNKIENKGAESLYTYDEDFIVRTPSVYEGLGKGGSFKISQAIGNGIQAIYRGAVKDE